MVVGVDQAGQYHVPGGVEDLIMAVDRCAACGHDLDDLGSLDHHATGRVLGRRREHGQGVLEPGAVHATNSV